MKIDSLKVNGFGTLENKEITFQNGINIIYGKNESGKSTLLKFISGIFFGLSKNKNGNEISDIEKYTPWKNKDFSGKLIYELDNKNKYEIFREFNKKNVKIFNENSEDISNKFNINKNGNEFFYEQTNIDEELFLNTGISLQEKTKLDKSKQSTLIQKISNLVSSGDDNISFKKTIKALNDRLLEEVGSSRTSDRPINIMNDRLSELKRSLIDAEEINNKIINIDEEKNIINNEIKEDEIKIELIRKIKNKIEKENIESEKIKINENLIEEIRNKINIFKKEIEIKEININKAEEKNKLNINKIIKKNKLINNILIPIFILVNIILFIFIKNRYALTYCGALSLIVLILFVINLVKINKLNNNKAKISDNKLINELNKLKTEIKIQEENKSNKEKEINELINGFNLNKEKENKIIINEYFDKINPEEINNLINLNPEEINNKFNYLENKLNNNKIKLHTLDLDKNNILPKLEKQISKLEEIKSLEEQKEELNVLASLINLAKSELELAYDEMKQNVIPKFTEELSLLINKITNGKYKNMKYNDEEGLIVELENGNYANSNVLSVGTIDQMYLALRLLSIKEVTKENMPIILDETFAMSDDERLKNILIFLNDNYKGNQKLIFTCTKREINILNEIKVEYNLIEL